MGVDPVFFPSALAFGEWLSQHHAKATEVAVGFYKVGTGKPSLTWKEAVDEALCYGWIDGVRHAFSEESYTIRFTPRRPRSNWSKINTENVARLVACGRMKEAGLKEVEAAKADGRWEAAYAGPRESEIPSEFMALLEGNPRAKATFDTMSKANQYAIAYRLQTAKRPQTKEKRMRDFIERLERGEGFH